MHETVAHADNIVPRYFRAGRTFVGWDSIRRLADHLDKMQEGKLKDSIYLNIRVASTLCQVDGFLREVAHLPHGNDGIMS